MLIAVDVDGTLLNSELEDRIASRELQALQAAREAGHTVVISTGRNLKSVEGLFAQSGWFPDDLPLILLNGATVWGGHPRRLLSCRLLDADDIVTLIDLFRRFGVAPMIYGADDDGGILHHEPGRKNDILASYLNKREVAVGAMAQVPDLLEKTPRRALEVGSIDEKDRVLMLTAAIGEEMGERVKIINTRSLLGEGRYFWVEAFAAECGKGAGLNILRREYPEVRGPLVAIGDNYNDLDMFAVADFSVAMAGGPEDVLAQADLVTCPVSEGGAALVLNQLADGVYPPRIEV